MKYVGLLMISMGIVVFIASILTGITTDAENTKFVMYMEWLMGFGQLLVIAGIGFILYDIAEKQIRSKPQKVKERTTEKQVQAKEAEMDCPNCNQKTKFPFSMVGSIVECPNCKTKVTIKVVQGRSEKEDYKWE